MQNLCDKSNTTCERCPSRLPTCVGQPDGDHTFPTRMWKPDYITCNKNRTILPTKTCPTGYFHPIKEMCIDDVTKRNTFFISIQQFGIHLVFVVFKDATMKRLISVNLSKPVQTKFDLHSYLLLQTHTSCIPRLAP